MQRSLKTRSSSNTRSPAGLVNNNSENLQEKLTQKAYVHHTHGGHAHGHSWDDTLNADRKVESQHEGKKKVRELSRTAKETKRVVG